MGCARCGGCSREFKGTDRSNREPDHRRVFEEEKWADLLPVMISDLSRRMLRLESWYVIYILFTVTALDSRGTPGSGRSDNHYLSAIMARRLLVCPH
jgi:hypothetical protein